MDCSKVNALIEVAMSWLDRGIATIPLGYRSKRPAISSWQEYKNRLPTEDEIAGWYKMRRNIGLVCAWQGLTVLDFDTMPAYEMWQALYGVQSYEVRTARGVHVYVYLDCPPEFTLKWAGGDIKANGYVLIPPSIHPSGAGYKASNRPILRFRSLDDLLPPELWQNDAAERGLVSSPIDPIWSAPVAAGNGRYSDINQRIRLLSFFGDAKPTGGGWYAVKCPLHDDKNASGWIDDRRNRYGCHACVNGSLSAIDFYAAWRKLTPEAAAAELSGL